MAPEGRVNPAEEKKTQPFGEGGALKRAEARLDGSSGRTGSALAGTCARVPVFKPAGRSLKQPQYSRHHHVASTSSDTAPFLIVAAVRRTVTAACSDGPGQGQDHNGSENSGSP
jgi:hypothetical protein